MTIIKNLQLDQNNLPITLPYLNMDDLMLLPLGNEALELYAPEDLQILDIALQNKERLIGIIPTEDNIKITNIGCAGRITSFIETDDARYLIGLTGICRFEVEEVFISKNSITKIRPYWDNFLNDLNLYSEKITNRTSFNSLISDYFKIIEKNKNYNLSKIKKLSDQKLISLLSTHLLRKADNKDQFMQAKSLNDLAILFHQFIEVEMAEHESRTIIKH